MKYKSLSPFWQTVLGVFTALVIFKILPKVLGGLAVGILGIEGAVGLLIIAAAIFVGFFGPAILVTVLLVNYLRGGKCEEEELCPEPPAEAGTA